MDYRAVNGSGQWSGAYRDAETVGRRHVAPEVRGLVDTCQNVDGLDRAFAIPTRPTEDSQRLEARTSQDIGPAYILRRVEHDAITLLCGATPVASTIVAAAEDLRTDGDAVPGEGITRMVSGGAPTPAAVIEHFERVTGWEMIHAYASWAASRATKR